ALRHSLAGRVGGALEPVSKLAGFDWRTNIALVGGVAAKEVIVSTLGTAYSLGEVEAEEAQPLSERLATDPQWSAITAISLIVFVLLYAPCFVTVVAMAKESSWRWAAFSTIFNTALAFAMATAIYQLGRLLS
ncbi:nucleoside recognition domain-containing protein, partial [Desulfocurvibacter africanus]